MDKKAQSEVIAVLLILAVSVSAVYTAYTWALPRIERSQDASRIRTLQNVFQEFNRNFDQVLYEGVGSQRIIEFSFEKGNVIIDPEQETLTYTINTILQQIPQEELGLESRVNDGAIKIILDVGKNIDLRTPAEGITVLTPRQYTITIQNIGGNQILVRQGLRAEGVVATRIVQGVVFYNETPEGTSDPVYDESEIPLAGATVTIMNTNEEIVVVTKTNSRGEFAAELEYEPQVGAGTRYYIAVKATGFIMKEYETDILPPRAVDYYNGYWNDDCNELAPDPDGYVVPTSGNFGILPITHSADETPNVIYLPMYQRTPEEILEVAPIAVIIGATNTGTGMEGSRDPKYYNSLIYDVKDAFDWDETTFCKHFLVFTGVDDAHVPASPPYENPDQYAIRLKNDDLGTTGNVVYYPETSQPIDVYPLQFLFEGFYDNVAWDGDPDLTERYGELASIGGNENLVDIFDFSLVIIGSGATNNDFILYDDLNQELCSNNSLQILTEYSDVLSEFIQTGPFNFRGITFARGLTSFAQFSKFDDEDDPVTPEDENIDVTPDWKYSPYRGILEHTMNPGEWNTANVTFNDFDAAINAANDHIPPDWTSEWSDVTDMPRLYNDFVDVDDDGWVERSNSDDYLRYLEGDCPRYFSNNQHGETYYNEWYEVVNYPDTLMFRDNASKYHIEEKYLNTSSYSWIPDWMGYNLGIGNDIDLDQGFYWESQQSLYYGIISCDYLGGSAPEWIKRKLIYPPITYDFKGAYGEYQMPSIYETSSGHITNKWKDYTIEIPEREGTNARIAGYFAAHPIFTGIIELSYELTLSTHGYLSIDGTGWDALDVAMYRKGFSKPTEREEGVRWEGFVLNNEYVLGVDFENRDLDIGNLGYSYQLIEPGPSMLIKERRDIDDNLIASMLITTYDLDRYGNNRCEYNGTPDIQPGEEKIGDTHSEVYWDLNNNGSYTYGEDDNENGMLDLGEDNNGNGRLDYGEEQWRSYAHRLERNIVLWALGHEELVPEG
jgi:hypothetical protein